jgi:lactase-phlorizin hydrolase
MDNFEWIEGYGPKFGLVHVNFSDPDRTRTPKASFQFYKQLVTENGFLPGYPGDGGRGTAPEYESRFYYDVFPDDFVWSSATMVKCDSYNNNCMSTMNKLKNTKKTTQQKSPKIQ